VHNIPVVRSLPVGGAGEPDRTSEAIVPQTGGEASLSPAGAIQSSWVLVYVHLDLMFAVCFEKHRQVLFNVASPHSVLLDLRLAIS
jgi:hypothetical protein